MTKKTVVRVLNAGSRRLCVQSVRPRRIDRSLETLIRRGKGEGAGIIRISELEINTSDRIVLIGSKNVNLTGMEYRATDVLLIAEALS